MNTLNFLDANVWLALPWSRHIHSDTARLWFEKAGGGVFLPPLQITVLRLLTTDKVMGRDTKTMTEVWALWDRVWAYICVLFLPKPANIEKDFRSYSRLSSLSPKVWNETETPKYAIKEISELRLNVNNRLLKSM